TIAEAVSRMATTFSIVGSVKKEGAMEPSAFPMQSRSRVTHSFINLEMPPESMPSMKPVNHLDWARLQASRSQVNLPESCQVRIGCGFIIRANDGHRLTRRMFQLGKATI